MAVLKATGSGMAPMYRLLLATILVMLLALGAGLFVHLGVYDVAATRQHTGPVYWLMETALLKSVQARAKGIAVPDLSDPDRIHRGLRLYQDHCRQCHGGPGVAPDALGLGMQPLPSNLVHTAREWEPGWIFWVVKHGVKMTGMPAWRYRLSDQDLWDIVAFVETLPGLSPEEYRRLVARQANRSPSADRPQSRTPTPEAPGDPRAGRQAMAQYGCPTCHVIPGVVGANKPVGPPLTAMSQRRFIAGVLPNSFDNMVRWLMHPQQVDPRSAMPDLGVTEQDARDMAAYLETLTKPSG